MVRFKGLKLLAYGIISLISNRYTETIEKVEEELDNNNLVTYLNKKYKNNFMVDFESSTYNICELNEYFQNYSEYIQGNESRKFGIVREEDGLLLIISLIINNLELPKKDD
ncbi:hypothetical protein K144312032_12180 [Clostridium tetani]|uniref:hypothetical protein n=1 Tax=Clostridium tetani TaxID=1513 RepID=UPI0029553CFE|nr:hypothetical protein [Clostridium tetani]BDR66990.1 hypothetical protein K144312032_12180 [Clostridium tetani]